MQKSLFIAKPKHKLQGKKTHKEKINIYAKKLSSSSVNHRKKALFRLLQIGPDHLADYSLLSGKFKISHNLIFLATPEQLKTLNNHLAMILNNQLKIEKGEYSNFFEFDEIGMIKSEIGVMSSMAWKAMQINENYKNLPDPRTHIFWLSLCKPKRSFIFKTIEEFNNNRKNNLKCVGKLEKISSNLNQHSNSPKHFKQKKNSLKLKNRGNFRIKSNSRKKNRPNSRSRCSVRISRPRSGKNNSKEPLKLKDSTIFSSMLEKLDKRMKKKISQANNNSPKFFTPKMNKSKICKEEDKKRGNQLVEYSPEWKERRRQRMNSRGRFQRAVKNFMRQRADNEKREKARSMELRFRKYANRERVSVF